MLQGYLDGSRPILIRTDFSDDVVWRQLVRELQGTPRERDAVFTLERLESSACDGWTPDDFRRARTTYDRTGAARVYLADRTTMTHPEHPVLVMWQSDDWPWVTCRVLPEAVGEVDLGLSIGTRTVADFSAAAGVDGIYRGVLTPGGAARVAARVLQPVALRLGDRLLYRASNSPMVGDDVVELQLRLTELGYEVGPCDGVFSEQTEDALLAFQREFALVADGCCGPVTVGALLGDDGPSSVREPRRPIPPDDDLSAEALRPDGP